MVFYAGHESECELCGDVIYEGDAAAYDSQSTSEAVHEDCAEEARRERMDELEEMIKGL